MDYLLCHEKRQKFALCYNPNRTRGCSFKQKKVSEVRINAGCFHLSLEYKDSEQGNGQHGMVPNPLTLDSSAGGGGMG